MITMIIYTEQRVKSCQDLIIKITQILKNLNRCCNFVVFSLKIFLISHPDNESFECFNRLAIGTMSSNVLEYAYQLRSVEDPAASDHTLSLDTYYNPLLRLKEPTYHIISSDYLYKCDQPISHAQRDSSNPVESKFWPLQLTHAEKNYVQQFLLNHTLLFIDERLLPENGLLKIAFSNSQIQPNCFYTPYYNLRKTSQTID